MTNLRKFTLVSCSFLLPFLAEAQIITTVAGSSVTTFGGDGGAATAGLMSMPMGLAADGSGNVYIADQGNYRIRKVSAAGIITTFAGNGGAGYGGDGGPAASAEINATGVAADGAGNVYIADYWNNRVRKVNSSGIISTVAGNGVAGFLGDGLAATTAELNGPASVAVDAAGDIYIADETNERIRKVNTSGIISTIAGTGVGGFAGDGGPAISAEFKNPSGVAVDASGNIYIADQINGRIRKINGAGVINTIGGTGTLGYSGDGGPAISAEFYQPCAVAVDAAGNVYVADMVNNRVRVINTSGIVNTLAGNGVSAFGGDGGPATSGEMNEVAGVAVDAAGNVYAADYNSNRVRKVNTAGIISTLAGNSIVDFGDGGPATNGSLYEPQDVAFSPAGLLYICDNGDNRIRKVSATGIITTVAGTDAGGYSGDGVPAVGAELNFPNGICFDAAGNLYIADDGNARIRKVNTSGIISTIGGIGTAGYSGDGGPAIAAELSSPQIITCDPAGNVYFTDVNRYIRRISTTGIINTIAGSGSYTGSAIDGNPASEASFGALTGLCIDPFGNFYVSDLAEHVVWRIDATGTMHLFAGSYVSGYTGDGGAATAAQFKLVTGVSSDGAGNIFICDEGANVVRVVYTTGIVETIAGNGYPGYSGDGGAATSATMDAPEVAKVGPGGDIYIPERINRVVRKISGGGVPLSVAALPAIKASVSIYPNPASGNFTVASSENISRIAVLNIAGQPVFSTNCSGRSVDVCIANLPAGMYFVKVNDGCIRKLLIE